MPSAKVTISFGLVIIPVSLAPATDAGPAVSFHRIHTKDGGRVRNVAVCSLDDEEAPREDIGRGYVTGDRVVPVTDEDLERLPLPTAKVLTILSFVDSSEVDPLQIGKPYYVRAEGPSAKPYELLRRAMEDQGQVALGKVALRGRETLAMIIRPMNQMLVMHALLWPDQLCSPAGVVPDRPVEITAQELQAAEELMDSYGPLDEEDLRDHCREELEEIVQAKLEEREPEVEAEKPAPGGKIVDLMAALEGSVRSARQSRGDTGEEATVTPLRAVQKAVAPEERPPARKPTDSAAKKSTRAPKATDGKAATRTKKTAKKAAGKKTTGRRAG
ncbi:DNA repair protein [Streptomyces sp. NRRL F-5755]|uniref:non-homologous end joining protein Ku n=1 Tax=Streptomyces sp. NRRL F-5755 TaxID=1519475 RepID=UPI0006B00F02|nr:Ku protein [Streptomyces sp. NRRL F-5755]KOT90399.1 DNA repair protein [Streptomyces sp. NRRL F-5755]